MPVIGRNTKSTRLNELTDEQIQAKWAALYPKARLWMALAAGATVGLYLLNHLVKLPLRMLELANIGFQISAIFSVCFLALTVACLYFRTDAWHKNLREQ